MNRTEFWMRLNSAIPLLIICNVALGSTFLSTTILDTGKVVGLGGSALARAGENGSTSPKLVATLVRGQAFLTARINLATLGYTEPAGPTALALNLMPQTQSTPSSSSATDSPVGKTVTTSSLSASSVNSSFGFDALNQIQSCNCAPPDVQVATGPNSLIEMVNLETEIFSKQGSSLKSLPLSTFFSTGADSISDPKVFFDSPSGRFFASIVDISALSIKVAVSASSDPAGTWTIFTIGTGGKCPDQPIIGISNDKFVASANDFTSCSRTGKLAGAQFWVLNKSEMVAGAANIDLAFFGPNSTLFSVHPVHSLGSTATEFMVSTGSGSKVNSVEIFSITGVPPGTVAVSMVSLSISPITLPPGGVQPGTSVLVNTGDARVEDATWLQGKIWYTFNEGCTPPGDTATRSCLRLTQVNTSTSAIIQDFDFGASGKYYFYPALRVDSLGSLDVIYGYSSSTIFPSLAVTGRATNDPIGSLAQPKNLKLGSADQTTGRYGDYFGAGVDPSNTTTVWVAGEYTSNTGGVWSTFIANMTIVSSDFVISANPQVSILSPGLSALFNISLNSINRFTGSVSLTANVSPVIANGPTTVLKPTTLNLTAGGSGNSTLTVSTTSATPAGIYSVTLTGVSGSLSHSVAVSVQIFDFSISNSGAITIVQGGSGSSTINVTLLGGPSMPVSLSCVGGLPSDTSCSFLPPSGSPTFTSSLTITASSSTPSGTYTITVDGSNGGFSHKIQVTLTVLPASIMGGGRGFFQE